MGNYKASGIYMIEVDKSTVKIVNSSIYGIFGNCKKVPANRPIFIDFSRKPKITYSFKKPKK